MSFKTAQVSFNVQSQILKDLGATQPEFAAFLGQTIDIAKGTTVGLCDVSNQNRLTIADSSTPQTIDLSSGTLKDQAGDPATMVEACVIAAINRSTTQTVTVGGGTTPVIGAFPLPPGAGMLIFNFNNPAWSTAAGSQNLKFSAGGGTNVLVDYIVLGRSA
jgi:hypothetical protein